MRVCIDFLSVVRAIFELRLTLWHRQAERRDYGPQDMGVDSIQVPSIKEPPQHRVNQQGYPVSAFGVLGQY